MSNLVLNLKGLYKSFLTASDGTRIMSGRESEMEVMKRDLATQIICPLKLNKNPEFDEKILHDIDGDLFVFLCGKVFMKIDSCKPAMQVQDAAAPTREVKAPLFAQQAETSSVQSVIRIIVKIGCLEGYVTIWQFQD